MWIGIDACCLRDWGEQKSEKRRIAILFRVMQDSDAVGCFTFASRLDRVEGSR
jgi:hypothetical protein